jgi:hypothetical protein
MRLRTFSGFQVPGSQVPGSVQGFGSRVSVRGSGALSAAGHPPARALRERPEDIEALTKHFLARAGRELTFTDDAQRAGPDAARGAHRQVDGPVARTSRGRTCAIAFDEA